MNNLISYKNAALTCNNTCQLKLQTKQIKIYASQFIDEVKGLITTLRKDAYISLDFGWSGCNLRCSEVVKLKDEVGVVYVQDRFILWYVAGHSVTYLAM